MTSVLIDASGLHSGGGVQVAISFLDELSGLIDEGHILTRWISRLQVDASHEVAVELTTGTAETLNLTRIDRRPTNVKRWIPTKPMFDVSFVVFGPEYGAPRARRRVVGFADITSVLSRPSQLQKQTKWGRARSASRGALSRYLHSQADLLITETEATAQTLATRLGRRTPHICVVPNTINRLFYDECKWEPLKTALAVPPGVSTLLYVARAYEHKNHRILSDVARLLESAYGIAVNFVVTLTDEEWDKLPVGKRHALVNVGPLRVAQVPRLLQACDGAIFPSLMESYSATPLEAMVMERLLFASDSPFVRSTCGDAPLYFDPTSAMSIAATIASAHKSTHAQQQYAERARIVISRLRGPRHRALRYLEILRAQAWRSNGTVSGSGLQ